ncbi:histone acetyltransferase HPA2 and related acetyltransferases [Vibrio maritimus]|uniref:Histone acetyltransferase HPA2 and related acetyltransferases n=1 Tax=Vibrio maritimus TaxID=990268 RepID=A0A090T5R5_9VIBR|nr:histone acetyltransferase HPA2 and related acetyltransferases [Vibrio maritimus]
MEVYVQISKEIQIDEVINLYHANGWSSAKVPDKLMPALLNSDTLVTARKEGKLIGIGNAISDGHLVVYYPHMLVDPAFHGFGVGRKMISLMQSKYKDFHQQMLTADSEAVDFYRALGFERAGKTEPMWVYAGNDH